MKVLVWKIGFVSNSRCEKKSSQDWKFINCIKHEPTDKGACPGFALLVLHHSVITTNKRVYLWVHATFVISRAQQQEQREMKLRLQQEVDPGNSNWEFLQMIRCDMSWYHHMRQIQ